MPATVKQMPPGVRFFFSRIFPLIFVIVGAGVGYAGLRSLENARASTRWPGAPGKVLASSVERHVSSGSKGTTVTYHAGILYEFKVGGTTYDGTRVAYGDYGSSSVSHARRIVNRYPKGSAVTVHYMPGHPEECLLEPGLKGQALIMPGVGLIFFLAGLLMAVYVPRSMKRRDMLIQNATQDGVYRGPEEPR